MSEVRYMISDAADKLGMEAHVLRYWEEELDLDVPRNEMGHRYYTEEWIRTFDRIRVLKQRGYQLRAIKMLLHSQNPWAEEERLFYIEKSLAETADKSAELVPLPAAGTADVAIRMEQFQNLMTSIVKKALVENNQELSRTVGEQVGETVIKEMNYLMREKEEQEEARFRKLDETLRKRQKKVVRGEKEVFWKRKRVPKIFATQEET